MEDSERIALALAGFCPNGKRHTYVNTNMEHIKGNIFRVTGRCAGCAVEWDGEIQVNSFEIQEKT